MSLNKKTFLFTTTIIGVALLLVFIASRTILLGGFTDLETKLFERNVERINKALANEVSKLDTLNRDWANWDDSYQFVQDQNSAFVEANLNVNTTFKNAGLNAIIFSDNEGKITYAKGFDTTKEVEVRVWDSLRSHVTREDVLITHIGKDSILGLIGLPEGLVMVSSIPILKSDGSGPAKGTLIMAKFVDDEVINILNEVSQVETSFISLADGPKFDDGEKVIINRLDAQKLEGFGKVNDIYGNAVALLKISIDREVYVAGNAVLSYFFLAIFLIGSIVVAGGVYFQQKYVLSPIYKLSATLNKIRAKRDLSTRVEVIGRDEIARLAGDVNAMLTSLQEFNQASKDHERALSEKLQVIEKQNQALEKTKVAMTNLLEDERELEATIRKEHDRLDLIINSMGEGLLVIDKEFKVITINPTAQNLLDVKAGDIVGRKWSDLAATYKKESATPLSERSFSKAINEGKTTITELVDDHYYKTKSGKMFPIISITAPLKVEGNIVGAVKVFRDATSERSSRQAIENEVAERTQELWEERARMFASINSLNMGFIIADRKNQIIVKNPAVSELLNIPDREITISRLSDEFASNIDLKVLSDVCINEKTSYGRDDIYYKDKFLRIFLTPVVTKEDNSGYKAPKEQDEAIGYVLLLEDVTNEKQLSRAKDEFFAVASHELRTPLTAIRGNTSLIMDYYADKIDDTDLKEMVSDMHESSVRLIDIVNDFLDASRLEQGKVDFKIEAVNMTDLMKKGISELDEFAAQRGLKIEFADPGAPIITQADNDRVRQIVNNLLGNAIKFTKEGKIQVSVEVNGQVVKVMVSDTGSGISPANQRLLFKKFQQAGEKVLARDVTKGTGMGLYISKLLAEGMGGKIYLEKSELGKGSTFAFELPLKK